MLTMIGLLNNYLDYKSEKIELKIGPFCLSLLGHNENVNLPRRCKSAQKFCDIRESISFICMSIAAENFDRWIRTSFIDINTELEELYFRQDDPSQVAGSGDALKATLLQEGQEFVEPLSAEGNTDKQFDAAYDVLGNLGLLFAALRRHELTNPDRETESPFTQGSALGMHIAASIGVVPRFSTAHLTTHCRAVNGVQKSFTSLKDERFFLDYNLLGILGYKRAGAALMRIPLMGVSAPGAAVLLEEAKVALEQVVRHNKTLFDELDVARFFFCIRPYYKPHRVGKEVYRGRQCRRFC